MKVVRHETPPLGAEFNYFTVVGGELRNARGNRVVECACRCGARRLLPICLLVTLQCVMCRSCALAKSKRWFRGRPAP